MLPFEMAAPYSGFMKSKDAVTEIAEILAADRAAKKLIINPKEAQLVRHIFKRFIQIGSATLLAVENKATFEFQREMVKTRRGSTIFKDDAIDKAKCRATL